MPEKRMPERPEPALSRLVREQEEREKRAHREPSRQPRRPRKALLFVLGALVILAAVGTGFLLWRRHRGAAREAARLEDQQAQGRKLQVAIVELPKAERTVTLPGDVRPFVEVGVLPKVNGYLRSVNVDKGDRVKAGALLGVIESPETDQQVAAARSTLRLRHVTAARIGRLSRLEYVSKQERDNAVEALRSAQADYRRLLALQKYEILQAPFDGVVAARNADPGALVSASSPQPIFLIDDPKRLRVQVYAAQDVAPFLRVGDAAEITADERPGQMIHAQVSRVADAMDQRTRTMLVEVWLDNESTRLLPGIFTHVTLHVRVPPLPVVPSNAVLSRGEKTLAAVVQEKKLHLQPIETGLDDGKVVQVRQGLSAGQTVALDVPSELGEGAPIEPVFPQKGNPQARQGPTPPRGPGNEPHESRKTSGK